MVKTNIPWLKMDETHCNAFISIALQPHIPQFLEDLETAKLGTIIEHAKILDALLVAFQLLQQTPDHSLLEYWMRLCNSLKQEVAYYASISESGAFTDRRNIQLVMCELNLEYSGIWDAELRKSVERLSLVHFCFAALTGNSGPDGNESLY